MVPAAQEPHTSSAPTVRLYRAEASATDTLETYFYAKDDAEAAKVIADPRAIGGWECVGAGYIEDVEFYEDDCEVVCRHCESPTQQKRPGEKSINTRPPPIREGFGVFCTNLKCQAFGHELDEQEIRCITGHSPAASVVGVLFCSPFLSGRESARFPDDSFDFL